MVEKAAGVVTMKSRTGQPYCVPHLQSQLEAVMVDGDVFDGEIYLHGYCLEEITSAVGRTDTQEAIDACTRKIGKIKTNTELQSALLERDAAHLIHNLRPELEFHVFDLPQIDEEFAYKVAIIHDLFNTFRNSPCLEQVVYTIINDAEDMKLHHADCVQRGYEGVMLRNYTGKYESGKRSADLQKYKTFMDSEFQILAVNPDKDGNGVFTVQNHYADNTFEVTMGSHAERVAQLANKEAYIGKWLNVQFQTLYKKTKLPQFPTGKYLRDCDVDGKPLN
tara:strand:+ start:47 stop:880 length:834 start_codon:yes stop_codon:yes gene_type:complete